MLVLGFLFIFLSVTINKNKKKEIEMIETEREKQIAKEKRKPEDVHSLLEIDPIEFEFGYNIIPLVDASQGGDLRQGYNDKEAVCNRTWNDNPGNQAEGQHAA